MFGKGMIHPIAKQMRSHMNPESANVHKFDKMWATYSKVSKFYPQFWSNFAIRYIWAQRFHLDMSANETTA